MKIDFKFDRKMVIKYSIICSISLFIMVYFITALIRFNSLADANTQNELRLGKLILDINREKKNTEKLGGLNDGYIRNLYFEKEIDFFEYIRKIFGRYRINLSIYQSKDSGENPEVILNYVINSNDFFRLVRDIEKGSKFITIKSLVVKKDKFPMLKVYMKVTGYFR